MEDEKGYAHHIKEYIEKNLVKGYTKDSLKIALLRQGYSRLSISKAFKMVEEDMANKAPVLDTKPKITREITPIDSSKKSFWRKLFG